jgi:hypothetical protein
MVEYNGPLELRRSVNAIGCTNERAIVVNGEEAGHPFRGNQFGDGEGGSSKESGSEDGKFSTSYGAVEKTDYDHTVEKALLSAKTEGIKATTDSKKAERHASEAASYVNENSGKTGYTVYGSTQRTPDGKYVPLVVYGAGTSNAGARKIDSKLKQGGFKTSRAADGGGFYVTHSHADIGFW